MQQSDRYEEIYKEADQYVEKVIFTMQRFMPGYVMETHTEALIKGAFVEGTMREWNRHMKQVYERLAELEKR